MMSPLDTEDDRRLARKAADYMLREHGDDALAEVEQALREAKLGNNATAIDAFEDILVLLRETRQA
ncbi:hypothetical protein GCM10011390_34330 [Aureimonas endophytica]|uniref:Uncharacterized protein n=1 Tax=Aureimonas endophytica TaxID=2027858 RepID=A0A916ZTT7_9HYPH|nr:hypothetical protein [Aureimonas endophytica]GGE12294.1 hypothetical protein GCM10011390_34330 [Aureimonas endophytica]